MLLLFLSAFYNEEYLLASKTIVYITLHLIIRQKQWNSLCVESIGWFGLLLRINHVFSPVNYFDWNMNEVFI